MLSHPTRFTVQAAIGGLAWVAFVGAVSLYGLRWSASGLSVTLGAIAVLGGVAAMTSLLRTRLTFEPATRRLTLDRRRGLFRRNLVSAELAEDRALAIQQMAADSFRLVVQPLDGDALPLDDVLVLSETQLRAEHARVHAFLFPDRVVPALPEGSLLPVCITEGPPQRVPADRVRSPVLMLLLPVSALVVAYGGCMAVVKDAYRYPAPEALRALDTIERTSKKQFAEGIPGPNDERVHAFCPSAPRAPATTPRGEKVMAPADTWRAPGWACLGYSTNTPQSYSLVYTSNYPATGADATFTIAAIGDLDGNGIESSFKLIGRGTETGEVTRVSVMIVNEDE